jgi:hypothetical protein
LTNLANGDALTFLVKVALAEGKVLFTERVTYVVGNNCEEEPENPGDAEEEESGDTALDETLVASQAKKVVENGQLFVIRNDVRYNVLGQQINN